MTLTEIVTALQHGKKVYYGSLGYQVIYDYHNGYFIKCTSTNHRIGLVWDDGRTLNGNSDQFFISEE